MIVDAVELALRQMGRNLWRTALTSLGVLIGVAAVITMVSVGQGATARIEQDLESLGGHLVFLIPGTGQAMGGGRTIADAFSLGDAEAVEREVGGLSAVAPMLVAEAVAVRDDLGWKTSVRGSTNAFLEVLAYDVARGRPFGEGELRSGAAVCLIGDTVREELFGPTAFVGERIRLGDVPCTVIGSLAPKGEDSFGMDRDDLVIMPIRAVQRRLLGRTDVAAIFGVVQEGADVTQVKAAMLEVMDLRRRTPPSGERDYSLRDMAEMASMLDQISTVLTSFLGAVAGVSLLVGGIGIMNIMLVSVAERTREIGIRRAVGAQARDVLLQFLVEAILLSLVGSAAGVLLALVLSWGLSTWLEVAWVVDVRIIGLSVAIAALVGVGFGWAPARRAARMSPIDALRHE